MDECLNDDDDEEAHRVFFNYFSAQHARLSVHAVCVTRKNGPVVTPVWPDPARDAPVPEMTYGYWGSAGL